MGPTRSLETSAITVARCTRQNVHLELGLICNPDVELPVGTSRDNVGAGRQGNKLFPGANGLEKTHGRSDEYAGAPETPVAAQETQSDPQDAEHCNQVDRPPVRGIERSKGPDQR